MDRRELYYDVAAAMRGEQHASMARLYTRIGGVAALSTALVAIAGTISGEWSVARLVFFALTVGAYFVVLIFAGLTIRPQDWHSAPQLKLLAMHIADREYQDEALIEWTADEMVRAATANQPRIERAYRRLKLAITALMFESVFLSASVITTGATSI